MLLDVTTSINLFNQHSVDWDNAFGNQCFDLANFYSYAIGGKPFTGATADLIYGQTQSGFYTAIPNTPDGIPQRGDIVVFNWPHVGIATGNSTTTTQFELLEQNDPEGSNCHLKTYLSYNGVIGWMRPVTLPEDQQATINELRIARDTNWNLYQKGIEAYNTLNVQYTTCMNQKQPPTQVSTPTPPVIVKPVVEKAPTQQPKVSLLQRLLAALKKI